MVHQVWQATKVPRGENLLYRNSSNLSIVKLVRAEDCTAIVSSSLSQKLPFHTTQACTFSPASESSPPLVPATFYHSAKALTESKD